MNKMPSASAGAIQVKRQDGDADERATACAVLRPSVGAAIATHTFYGSTFGGKHLDVGALADELVEQCAKVHGGDLKRMESMLVAQAHTLDALFNRLAQRAMQQEYLKQYETFLRLALKAQGQARATVEALAEIKNPRPVAFVKQANVGANVQVNNGSIGPYARGRARGNGADAPSGVLEARNGERLEPRAQGQAGRGDPALETLDTQHRAEDQGR